jgi:hypothetical protein
MVLAKKVREITGKTIADQVREALTMYYFEFTKAGVVTEKEVQAAREESRSKQPPRSEDRGAEPNARTSVGS